MGIEERRERHAELFESHSRRTIRSLGASRSCGRSTRAQKSGIAPADRPARPSAKHWTRCIWRIRIGRWRGALPFARRTRPSPPRPQLPRELTMKALTVGGAMIDTIAIIESDRIERMMMQNADTSFLLLEEGRKTEALEISTHCGGGAVNAAVSMARLGSTSPHSSSSARTSARKRCSARLMSEGVSTRYVRARRTAPTGASVLVSSHDRNAAVFTFRGANTLLGRRTSSRRVRSGSSSTSRHSATSRPTAIRDRRAWRRSAGRWLPPIPACASCRRAAARFNRSCRRSTCWRSTALKLRCW